MTKNQIKKTVCIQGLGHVGIAMAAAVAGARNTQDCAIYDVVGVDVETPDGCRKVAAVNLGECPIETTDPSLVAALKTANELGNLRATHST